MSRRLRAIAFAVVLAFTAGGCGGDSAKDPTEQTQEPRAPDIAGIYADDVFFRDGEYRTSTLGRQAKAGIHLIRQPFAWNEIEKAPGRFDFANHDDFVGRAARAGVRVLPVVLGPVPDFRPAQPGAAGRGMRPPAQPSHYASFVAALVRRYGSGGSYWDSHPDVPRLTVRSWQLWNEPNIEAFWATGPDPAAYAGLLKAGAAAVRRADPDAEVVAAGLPESANGTPIREFLDGMYSAGVKGAFDTAAIHPYAHDTGGVLERVRAMRRVMDANGDRGRIWITEVGWATAGVEGPFNLGREGQATAIERTMAALRAEWDALRLRGVVYFQWRDPDPYPGRREIWPFHAGLLDRHGRPKPGLRAYEEAIAALQRSIRGG